MLNIYAPYTASLVTGIFCGILLCIGKQNALVNQKLLLDRALSTLRYAIFAVFLFTILQLKTTNSILLIVLFLFSYLGTVFFCIKKTG